MEWQSSDRSRWAASASGALIVALGLQWTMQNLIETPEWTNVPCYTPVNDVAILPPAPAPTEPPAPSPPKLPARPPSLQGLTTVPPMEVTPPETPALTVPSISTAPVTPDRWAVMGTPQPIDRAAQARTPLRPAYPRAAQAAGKTGTVVAQFTVDAQGRVSGIRIVSVAPRGHGFEAAVRQALRSARFRPAMENGRTVGSTLSQTFHFKLE